MPKWKTVLDQWKNGGVLVYPRGTKTPFMWKMYLIIICHHAKNKINLEKIFPNKNLFFYLAFSRKKIMF